MVNAMAVALAWVVMLAVVWLWDRARNRTHTSNKFIYHGLGWGALGILAILTLIAGRRSWSDMAAVSFDDLEILFSLFVTYLIYLGLKQVMSGLLRTVRRTSQSQE